MVQARAYLLRNGVQDYYWGTMGAQAFIPRLLGETPIGGQPYAELWIGAHPTLPSQVQVDGQWLPLHHWIAADPAGVLGAAVAARFGGQLPFLLKVLSASQVLSIQAHPDKAQAERLHAVDPGHYPDDNHKPEIAVALEPVTTLAGMKDVAAMRAALQAYPEIAWFLGDQVVARARGRDITGEALVPILLGQLIRRATQEPNRLARAVEALAERLAMAPAPSEAEALFLEARERYGDRDAGLFAIFLMNLVHLRPGEGLYIPAGVPHAYVRGSMVECMANSDNVVRVGLTPKYVDAQALLDILDPRAGPLPTIRPGDGIETVYATTAAEFELVRLRLRGGGERVVTMARSVQVWLVTDGKADLTWSGGELHLARGASALLPGCLQGVTIRAARDTELFGVRVPRSA